MSISQYNKNSNKSLITGIAGFILVAFFICYWPPDSWWKEVMILLIASCSMYLVISKVIKEQKWRFIITCATFGFLILNRFRVLDLLTLALLTIIVGLISLIY